MSGPVTVTREDGLARVVLAAPPLNFFDEPVFAGLEAAVSELEADLPRAVLISPKAGWCREASTAKFANGALADGWRGSSRDSQPPLRSAAPAV